MSVSLEEVITMADEGKKPTENTEKDPEKDPEVAIIPPAISFYTQRTYKPLKFAFN
jgi:hypothetical protein